MIQHSLLLFLAILIFKPGNAQELYVFSEPASNIPAHSLSVRVNDHFIARDNSYARSSHRLMPQLMYGLSKKLMLSAGSTFSNMHTNDFRYESWNLYVKYRFLSRDEIHRHFRMAVFADGSSTRAPFHFDEINLMGDKGGIEFGIIATQLWNKLAVSGTFSQSQVLDKSRNSEIIYVPPRLYQSFNYSISAGYLLFPRKYKSYKQTNLNIYSELLGERSLDAKKYCLDWAPALQVIFSSNTKLNFGGRFQLAGNMNRMSTTNWMLGMERSFLNAFKRSR